MTKHSEILIATSIRESRTVSTYEFDVIPDLLAACSPDCEPTEEQVGLQADGSARMGVTYWGDIEGRTWQVTVWS